jgi:hypothetical protein
VAKAKADALDVSEIGLDTSLESLMTTFQALAQGVESQLAAENEEGLAVARGESAKALEAIITEETARRDQLVELMAAVEEREQRIRKTVAGAEKIARHYAAFVNGLKYSVSLYMTEKGISEINGKFHRFKLMGQPDQLQLDENAIPMEYRKFPLEHRMAEMLREARASILTMLKSTASEFQNRPEAYPVVEKIDAILKEVPAEASLGTPDKEKITAAIQAKRDVPGAALLTGRRRLDIK